MSDSNFGSILGGMIIGGAIGYVFGTLYAPKEGEAMRGELKEKYLEKSQQAEAVLRDFMAKEEEDLSQLKARVKELFSDWEGNVGVAKDKVKGHYTQQKESLLKELEKMESAFNAGKEVYSGVSTESEEEKTAEPEVKAKPKRRTTRAKSTTTRKKTATKSTRGGAKA